MLQKLLNLTRSLFLLMAVLILCGCGPYFQSVPTGGGSPTPLVVGIQGGTDDPNVFTEPVAFQEALLKALSARDAVKLQAWMTDPQSTGTWRGDLVNTARADAVKKLLAEELGANSRLTAIPLGEVQALMGGKDPRSLPRIEAGVTNAFLIGGWGKDGRDEAILFVARQRDNRLKLQGWMVIQGGFSGARLGGIQLYENKAQGYQVFLPKGYETNASGNQVAMVAPGEGPNRGLATLAVEPAQGRNTSAVAEQVIKTAQAQLGQGAKIDRKNMQIEDAVALVISGLPGQDPNRQLYMVRGDSLYHMTFSPDDPRAGKAFDQMQDLYAMIVNTLHFTNGQTAKPNITTPAAPTTEAPTIAWTGFTSPKYGYSIAYPSEMNVAVETAESVGDAVQIERVVFKLPSYGPYGQSSAIAIEAGQLAYPRPIECENLTEVVPGVQGCIRYLPAPQGVSQELVWFRVPAPGQGPLYFSVQLIYDDRKYLTAFAHMLQTFQYVGAPVTGTPASQSGCTYKAAFVADVTVPDNSVVAPGASFIKTWRVRNEGTCAWGYRTALHRLVSVGGDQLSPLRSVELPFPELGQGGTADLSVPMVAPNRPGTYQNNWRLQTDSGTQVGLGPTGQSFLTARIVVRGSANPTATPSATKNYTSNKYGYSINYPAEWTIKVQTFTPTGPGRDPEAVLLTAPNGMWATVQIYALKGAPPIQGYENCKNMTFNGVPACEIIKSDGPVPQRSLVFQKGDSYFVVDCRYTSIEQLDRYEEIVLSFRFTL